MHYTSKTSQKIKIETYQKKNELRSRMKRLRSNLSQEQIDAKSATITTQILALKEVQNAQVIFCYLSFGSEVATHHLVRHLLSQGKTICVPKMIKGQMRPIKIESLENLAPNKMGILEPIELEENKHLIEVCLTPGLAFTKDGKRLGYGGGNYDHFFTQNPDTYRIGLAFEIQMLEELPQDELDQLVNKVVTETTLDNKGYL